MSTQRRWTQTQLNMKNKLDDVNSEALDTDTFKHEGLPMGSNPFLTSLHRSLVSSCQPSLAVKSTMFNKL